MYIFSGSSVNIRASCLQSCLVKICFVCNWIISYQMTSASKKAVCQHDILESGVLHFAKGYFYMKLKENMSSHIFVISAKVSASVNQGLELGCLGLWNSTSFANSQFCFIFTQKNPFWSVIIFSYQFFFLCPGTLFCNCPNVYNEVNKFSILSIRNYKCK